MRDLPNDLSVVIVVAVALGYATVSWLRWRLWGASAALAAVGGIVRAFALVTTLTLLGAMIAAQLGAFVAEALIRYGVIR